MMITFAWPRHRLVYWLLLAAGLAAVGYGFLWYAMDSSFSISNPENIARYRREIVFSLGLMAAGALLLLFATVGLLRGRRGRPRR